MSLASIHPQSHSVLRPGFQTRHIYKAHDCPHHICSHQIETQPQYKLNITLLSLTFTGLDTVTCLTGGFRVLNFQAFEEAFCAPISSHATFKKTFYSFFKAAILYLYSYASYSHIEAEVTVQATKCKSIDIDPCIEKQRQMPLRGQGMIVVPVNNVASEIKYKWALTMKMDQEAVGNCVVLQIERMLVSLWRKGQQCALVLLPESVCISNAVVHHTIRFHFELLPNNLEQLEISSADAKTSVGIVSHLAQNNSIAMKRVCLNQSRHSSYSGHDTKVLWKSPSFKKKSDLYGYFQFEHQSSTFRRWHSSIDYSILGSWTSSWIEVVNKLSCLLESPEDPLLAFPPLKKISVSFWKEGAFSTTDFREKSVDSPHLKFSGKSPSETAHFQTILFYSGLLSNRAYMNSLAQKWSWQCGIWQGNSKY